MVESLLLYKMAAYKILVGIVKINGAAIKVMAIDIAEIGSAYIDVF